MLFNDQYSSKDTTGTNKGNSTGGFHSGEGLDIHLLGLRAL